jgi:hypothetical protein
MCGNIWRKGRERKGRERKGRERKGRERKGREFDNPAHKSSKELLICCN